MVPILVIGLLVGVFVVLAWPTPRPGGGTRPTAPPVATATPSARLEATAAELLRGWDRRRAGAWAAGDPRALSRLYLPGASAGEADVAMLGAWSARGLAVDRLTTQLLAVDVVAHGRRRWVLQVRDRVTGAVAVGRESVEPLPAGRVTSRVVELRRVAGVWRVAAVRPAAGRP